MSKQEHKTTDALLDALLHKLPDKPVTSNFTSRVLQRVALEQAAASRQPSWLDLLRHPLQLVPRIAVATAALCLGLFGYQHHVEGGNVRLAESVAAVAQVSSLPSPDVLKDFEAVRHLNRTPAPDEELLALLR
jgi:hypothetical protein